MSFSESPHTGPPKQQRVVGQITVPDDVTVGTVAVEVDITHPFKSDLKIDLVAPSGVVTSLYDGVADGVNPDDNLTELLVHLLQMTTPEPMLLSATAGMSQHLY